MRQEDSNESGAVSVPARVFPLRDPQSLHNSFSSFCSFFLTSLAPSISSFKTESHGGLKLTMQLIMTLNSWSLLPLPPKCRDYRHVLPTTPGLYGTGDQALGFLHAQQVLCQLSYILIQAMAMLITPSTMCTYVCVCMCCACMCHVCVCACEFITKLPDILNINYGKVE